MGRALRARTAFAREISPAREHLAESRTIKDGGIAGLATVGAAGIDIAHEVGGNAASVLPLVPYRETPRWLLIAAALAGMAVAIYARIDDLKGEAAVIAAGVLPLPPNDQTAPQGSTCRGGRSARHVSSADHVYALHLRGGGMI